MHDWMTEEQKALYKEICRKHPDLSEEMIIEMVWSRTAGGDENDDS